MLHTVPRALKGHLSRLMGLKNVHYGTGKKDWRGENPGLYFLPTLELASITFIVRQRGVIICKPAIFDHAHQVGDPCLRGYGFRGGLYTAPAYSPGNRAQCSQCRQYLGREAVLMHS